MCRQPAVTRSLDVKNCTLVLQPKLHSRIDQEFVETMVVLRS
jgi:hypothetical protein